MGQQQSSNTADGKHRHRWRSSKNNNAEAGGSVVVQGADGQASESKRASGTMNSLTSRVASRPVSVAGVPPSLQPGHGAVHAGQGQAAAAAAAPHGGGQYAGQGSGSSSVSSPRYVVRNSNFPEYRSSLKRSRGGSSSSESSRGRRECRRARRGRPALRQDLAGARPGCGRRCRKSR